MSIEQLDELGIEHKNGWVYGSLISNGNIPYIAGNIVEATDEYVAHEFWAKVIPETVSQYTGLKDKNGKEIYEGDVLTAEIYPFQDDGEYNYHGVIEWDKETASFYMWKALANKNKRGISHGIGEQIESIERFEVIGSIYENPELIMS